ncbi:MAG: peptide chain release factor N(5)-glutamine methyltransferase [Lentisphaerae bacterium]|jgi:release factor glutamine methyltransferase|nr:peptide chain release factor N(5)-glutamine methyltransferase [Lentisphaerota bacterium]MBT4815627.1 peptide chain release factor N(5)-glutamine methyltransferase [Lentisphaerota bacterium]MBT5611891.1 peptide chain release factor N(5)-glutamine methyltransferase [Lentisphaerota bacterium]MBT7055512.1 peptide chain release factor N(5)-glutamine methyltransferase [Lentisphaerota bacterium]MBT7847508.1 peptide chain release factor N(5)-glutamine methyltransferase [Lentisphaerota bacterium]
MTAKELLTKATDALAGIGIHNAAQEAGWIIRHITGVPPPQIQFAQSSPDVASEQATAILSQVARRCEGEPLQYILGTTEFYGLELQVGPGVLVPRPETERLVDFALGRAPHNGPICDLCTGSGAVALAMASRVGDTRTITGLDLSPSALAYARRNADALGFSNVTFRQTDLWEDTPRDAQFVLVTANPPYVAPCEYADLPIDVRDHEPPMALLAENNGLAIIARIAHESRPFMAPDAWLLCEIGSQQAARSLALFRGTGWEDVRIRQDYTGRDRVLEARNPSPETPLGNT